MDSVACVPEVVPFDTLPELLSLTDTKRITKIAIAITAAETPIIILLDFFKLFPHTRLARQNSFLIFRVKRALSVA